ncbi:MAG: hypothetical protein MPW15_00065 [Candidatus Manganitrophus sp.]|nr:hypothetical protein [Candidatus Manganitrophus sp.]
MPTTDDLDDLTPIQGLTLMNRVLRDVNNMGLGLGEAVVDQTENDITDHIGQIQERLSNGQFNDGPGSSELYAEPMTRTPLGESAMVKKGIIFGVLVGGFWGMGVAAAEELPNLYRGIRPLGMGGAFITLSDDENAMFYNPAGLNDVSGFGGVGLINPLVEVSKNTMGFVQDLNDLDTEDQQEVVDFLNERIGEHQHVRVWRSFRIFTCTTLQSAPWARRRSIWRFGIEGRIPRSLQMFESTPGSLASGAFGFFDQKLQVGVTGKFIQREGVNKTYSSVDIVNDTFDPIDDAEGRRKEIGLRPRYRNEGQFQKFPQAERCARRSEHHRS